MPANTNLILEAGNIGANTQERLRQLRAGRQEEAAGNLKLRELTEDRGRQDIVRQYVMGHAQQGKPLNLEELAQFQRRAGDTKGYLETSKAAAADRAAGTKQELDKTRLSIEQTKQTNMLLDAGLRELSGVFDQQSLDIGNDAYEAATGQPSPLKGRKYNKMEIEALKRKALTAKQGFELDLRKEAQADTQDYRQEQLDISRSRLGVAQGAAADAARHRSVMENKPPAPPSGYQAAPSGGLQGIPGGPADPANMMGPKLTESQGKATALSMRGGEAVDQLSAIEDAGYRPGYGTQAKQIAGSLMGSKNRFIGEQGQRYEQAAVNFGTAIGRFESGAEIRESEWGRFVEQYVAQPGDTEEVIAQKRQNRQTAERGIGIAAGPGQPSPNLGNIPARDPQVSRKPVPGDVEDGHVFLGGDPADPANWNRK